MFTDLIKALLTFVGAVIRLFVVVFIEAPLAILNILFGILASGCLGLVCAFVLFIIIVIF